MSLQFDVSVSAGHLRYINRSLEPRKWFKENQKIFWIFFYLIKTAGYPINI